MDIKELLNKTVKIGDHVTIGAAKGKINIQVKELKKKAKPETVEVK